MIEKILTDLVIFVFVLCFVYIVYQEVCTIKKPEGYPAIRSWELNDYHR